MLAFSLRRKSYSIESGIFEWGGKGRDVGRKGQEMGLEWRGVGEAYLRP